MEEELRVGWYFSYVPISCFLTVFHRSSIGALTNGVFLIVMESCKESEHRKSALVARRAMEPSIIMEEVEGVHTSHVAEEEAIDGKPTWEKQWIFGIKIAIFCNYGVIHGRASL